MNDNNPQPTSEDDTSVSLDLSRHLRSRFITQPGAIHLGRIRDFAIRVAEGSVGSSLNPVLQKHLNRYLINTGHSAAHSMSDRPLVRGTRVNAEQAPMTSPAPSAAVNNLTRPHTVNVSNTTEVKNTFVQWTEIKKTEIKKYFSNVIRGVDKSKDAVSKNVKQTTSAEAKAVVREVKKNAVIDRQPVMNVSAVMPEQSASLQTPVVRKNSTSVLNETERASDRNLALDKIKSPLSNKNDAFIDTGFSRPSVVVESTVNHSDKAGEISAPDRSRPVETKTAVPVVTESSAGLVSNTSQNLELKRDHGAKPIANARTITESSPTTGPSSVDTNKKNVPSAANQPVKRKTPAPVVAESNTGSVGNVNPNFEFKRNSPSINDAPMSRPDTTTSPADSGSLTSVSSSVDKAKLLTPENLNSTKYLTSSQALPIANNRSSVLNASKSSGNSRSSTGLSGQAAKIKPPGLLSRLILQRHQGPKVIVDQDQPVTQLPTNMSKQNETWSPTTKVVSAQSPDVRASEKLVYAKAESKTDKNNLINNPRSAKSATNQAYRPDQAAPVNRDFNHSDAPNNSDMNESNSTMNNNAAAMAQNNGLTSEMTEEMVERLFSKFVRNMAIEGERQEFMR